jgi:hypothetical protein
VKRVFVSHASADAELVDKFVDMLLRNGCNLTPEHIFYTSGEDTGIQSGQDLIATVRSEVGEATLVVAIITPTYQTRPVCVAELGAAWARAGLLLPLVVPDMPRGDLEGVLDGMAVRTLEDSGSLDELHDRVRDATGVEATVATWNRAKRQWLNALTDLVTKIPVPEAVTPAEVEQLQRDLDGARAGLDELEAENAEQRRQVEALSAIRPTAEVAEALLPDKDSERFDALVHEVRTAIRTFDGIVVEALWASRFDNGLSAPYEHDPYRDDEVARNVKAGFLEEGDDGVVYVATSAGSVHRAYTAVDRLQTFLTEECSEGFAIWFKEKYDFEPDLGKKHVWDQMF